MAALCSPCPPELTAPLFQYLFSAPEGYARLALEHRIRPSARLRACFTCSTAPRALGGLGGLIMRLRSDGHGEVRLVGGRGCAGAAAALRHVVSWRHPRLFVDEVGGAGGEVAAAYSDDVVEVVALSGDGKGPWRSPPAWAPAAGGGVGGGGAAASTNPSPAPPDPPEYELHPPDSFNPVYAAVRSRAGSGRGGSATHARLRPHPPPPPPPPSPWGWLVWVRAAGAAVLVVDCPDEATFAAGVAVHPACAAAAAAAAPGIIAAAIHLTPACVAGTPAYLAWAAALLPAARPSILAAVPPPHAPLACWIGHVSVATTLARLSTVDASLFPGGGGGGGEAGTTTTNAPHLPPPLTPGRLLLRVRGGAGVDGATLDDSDCLPPFDSEGVRAVTRAGLAAAGVDLVLPTAAPANPPAARKRPRTGGATTNAAAAAALRARLAGKAVVEEEEGKEEEEAGASPPPAHTTAAPPSLTFLGTGSAEPSAHRGASALFLAPDGDPTTPGLLLDAGEGTAAALRARSSSPATLAHLGAAWVSHRHADHCLGIAGVVAERWAGRAAAGLPLTPLPIIGPHAVRRWLVELVGAGTLPPASFTFTHAAARPSPVSPSTLAALRLSAWTPAPAIHCSDSHALVLDGTEGWRLAVSGDSVPCPGFAALASDADLLVHEATFGRGREGDAAAKRHATVAGALALATTARATRTVLTHFSQRYPGPPPDAEGDAGGWEAAGAVAAVDGMVVPLRGAGFERLPGTGRLAVSVLVALREAGSGGCGEEAGEQGGVAYDSE